MTSSTRSLTFSNTTRAPSCRASRCNRISRSDVPLRIVVIAEQSIAISFDIMIGDIAICLVRRPSKDFFQVREVLLGS